MNILFPRVNDHADTDRLHRMEFPLMQWLFALCYKLLGPHIAISRVLTFLIGLGSVYGMYYLCHKVFANRTIAVVCAWCFNWSPVFYYYTINPLPDNMALCCAIWSLGLFYTYLQTTKIRYAAGSALMLCIATLVKLPFILYGSFMLTFVLVQMWRKEFPGKQLLQVILIYAACIVPPAAWYATVIPTWNNGVVKGILDTQQDTNELLHILTHTLVSTLPELLLNYGSVLFFVAGIIYLFRSKANKHPYFLPFLALGISVILYFLFEMNMITTVHDYYLFPFLPLLFILVGYGGYKLLGMSGKLPVALAALCLLILPLTAFLRANSRWDTKDPGFNAAYYNNKDHLRSIIPPNARCVAGNDESHYIVLYYLDRKGWTFDHDELDSTKLDYYRSKGAQYLCSDSRIDETPAVKALLQKKIFEDGTLRIYELK